MKNSSQPWYYILLLILAGEAVFILPFVLPRIFRPTYLETFDFTNMELGYCFSIYGTVALCSYLLGGLVADKVSPGKLMALGLAATASGGLYAATFPSLKMMYVLYGIWGMTTILIFWAAMIKATRIWGGKERQGKAFGFLDGGRGLVAAGFGTVGLLVISIVAVKELELYDLETKKEIFGKVILVFSAIVFLVSILIFFLFKSDKEQKPKHSENKFDSKKIKSLLKLKSMYYIAIIILTGYSGYKMTDIFSLYAKDVMLYDEVKAAGIGTLLLYIRPIIGIAIGILADRKKPSVYLTLGFLCMTLGTGFLASGIIESGLITLFFIIIIATSIGIYSIRCLYFAVLEEVSIPVSLTGTAVGVVSVIGYTPDIFMGPIFGYFLDTYPGELGFQFLFAFVTVLALVGLVASYVIMGRRGDG